jgi:hypothetical protein
VLHHGYVGPDSDASRLSRHRAVGAASTTSGEHVDPRFSVRFIGHPPWCCWFRGTFWLRCFSAGFVLWSPCGAAALRLIPRGFVSGVGCVSALAGALAWYSVTVSAGKLLWSLALAGWSWSMLVSFVGTVAGYEGCAIRSGSRGVCISGVSFTVGFTAFIQHVGSWHASVRRLHRRVLLRLLARAGVAPRALLQHLQRCSRDLVYAAGGPLCVHFDLPPQLVAAAIIFILQQSPLSLFSSRYFSSRLPKSSFT